MRNDKIHYTQTEVMLLRLYAAHSALYAFTTTTGIERYLKGVLTEIPDIADSEVFLLDPANTEKIILHSKFVGEFALTTGKFSKNEFLNLCRKLERENISVYPIKAIDMIFGMMAVKIKSLKSMQLLDAVLNSFAISSTTILENTYQKKLLEISNKELTVHREHLTDLVNSQTLSLNRVNQELATILDKTVEAAASITEQRDPYTSGHQFRVAKLAEAIAKKLLLDPQEVHNIYMGALIHDIGKMRVPADILTSPAKLIPIEFEFIKMHPEAGYKMIRFVPFHKTISDIVHLHHERLDGSGYPNKLVDEQIPLAVKIVSVADVFEAMSSHRPYRPRHTIAETLDELIRGGGKRYDKTVVDCCVTLITQNKFKLPVPPYDINKGDDYVQ